MEYDFRDMTRREICCFLSLMKLNGMTSITVSKEQFDILQMEFLDLITGIDHMRETFNDGVAIISGVEIYVQND